MEDLTEQFFGADPATPLSPSSMNAAGSEPPDPHIDVKADGTGDRQTDRGTDAVPPTRWRHASGREYAAGEEMSSGNAPHSRWYQV